MRIVCISDTHDRHEEIAVPNGDVLVHSGDLTMTGSPATVVRAFAWLSALPHETVIFVPGNHDFAFERDPAFAEALAARFPRVQILVDAGTTVGGLRVYGSPYQPWFHSWAFNFAKGEAGEREAQERWALIPDDTSILITHGPVRGILDRTSRGEHVGCRQLAARIEALESLRLHVCGHIHEG
jgi:Icc-related predicted phosphoesterase